MRNVVLAWTLCSATALGQSPVTSPREDTSPLDTPWTTYSGDYRSLRHSALKQIAVDNVARLRPAWIYQAEQQGSLNASPLVVDGVMFLTELPATVTALDARTGRVLWRYRHALPEGHAVLWNNRGVAVGLGVVYYASHDGHLLALDAVSGRLLWSRRVADHTAGYALAAAPLLVANKVIVGSTTGTRAVRGFLDAYQARTGEKLWRFWTIPAPGEPGGDTWAGDSWRTGGVGAWLTGSFDPELNLLFWGAGSAVPVYDGEARAGDNLYAGSLLALNVDTGALRWHFQFTPHDRWDFDGCHIPILLDREFRGRMRKLVLTANKNGFYYVLDRTTGEFHHGSPFVRQNWAQGLDAAGKPIVREAAIPSDDWTVVRPTEQGGTTWSSPTFSPQTGLVYLTVRDEAMRVKRIAAPLAAGEVFNWGGAIDRLRAPDDFFGLRALQWDTGELRWEFKVAQPTYSGLLSTAGGLVFGGSTDGNFFALDAADGRAVWHFQTGGPVSGNPITFALRGRQYVATPAGGTVIAFALPSVTMQ
jgi:alcohol dehydrogenase (cytochrome c)